MSTTITIIPATESKELNRQSQYVDTRWLTYFRQDEALATVSAHLHSLPSANNPESKTIPAYKRGIRTFIEWSQNALPTESLIKRYIAYLSSQKKLGANTIATKYLAPLRHYLQAFTKQHITISGDERQYVEDCRLHIRNATTIKNPKPQRTTNQSALYAHGKRLTLQEYRAIFEATLYTTLTDKRDYALLYIGFTTALRIAEIARITLNTITRGTNTYEITVRGVSDRGTGPYTLTVTLE